MPESSNFRLKNLSSPFQYLKQNTQREKYQTPGNGPLKFLSVLGEELVTAQKGHFASRSTRRLSSIYLENLNKYNYRILFHPRELSDLHTFPSHCCFVCIWARRKLPLAPMGTLCGKVHVWRSSSKRGPQERQRFSFPLPQNTHLDYQATSVTITFVSQHTESHYLIIFFSVNQCERFIEKQNINTSTRISVYMTKRLMVQHRS